MKDTRQKTEDTERGGGRWEVADGECMQSKVASEGQYATTNNKILAV
jgi:hypothetical protein